MVTIKAKITPEWVAANERAYANRQQGRVVTMVRPGLYTAPSSKGDGTTYTVTIINVGTLAGTCTCPHGQHGNAGHCWHLAQALSAEVRRVSRKVAPVADSAAKAAPVPEPTYGPGQLAGAEIDRRMAAFGRS